MKSQAVRVWSMAARGRPQASERRLRSFCKPALNTGANTPLSDNDRHNVQARFSSFRSFPPLLARPTLVGTFPPTLLRSPLVPLPCDSLHNHRVSRYPSSTPVVLCDGEGQAWARKVAWVGTTQVPVFGKDMSEFCTFRLESIFWATLCVVLAIFGVILGLKGECQ